MTALAHSWILQVEDSEEDIILLREAFDEARIFNPVHVVTSGLEAIDYLGGSADYADRNKFPLPDLVLLDLKLPGLPGLEVLRWVRHQPHLGSLVVSMFTSSDNPVDINTAFQLGANAYIVKPSSNFDRVKVAGEIKARFLEGDSSTILGPAWRTAEPIVQYSRKGTS
jgi:CheY-like chemotaxis protein